MIVTCPRCKGRGGDPIYNDYPMAACNCYACEGTGKIKKGTLKYQREIIDAGFSAD